MPFFFYLQQCLHGDLQELYATLLVGDCPCHGCTQVPWTHWRFLSYGLSSWGMWHRIKTNTIANVVAHLFIFLNSLKFHKDITVFTYTALTGLQKRKGIWKSSVNCTNPVVLFLDPNWNGLMVFLIHQSVCCGIAKLLTIMVAVKFI